MQPQEGGRGPPHDPELEQRLRQANFGGSWQPGIAFAGQYGAAYGLPYAVAPGFPSQAQLAYSYLTPARDRLANPAQGMHWNQTQATGSRPSSALGHRQPVPVPPAAAMSPYTPFYSQASAGYPIQYLSPPGQWGSVPAQQAALAPYIPQSQAVMAPFAFPGGQAYPRPQGRQGGRQPYRGQPNRHLGANRAQGRGQYRAMWQEVNQVSQGQNWQNNMRHRVSVEDLIIILQRLPPGTPPVPSVAQGLHNLDSRACAALLKDLSKVGLPHHALTIFEWLQSLPHEHDLARLCDVFTYTTVISLCGQRQELGKALTLVADMRGRGITPNIHTYTALINTCIRSGDHSLALDVFQTLQEEGCQPNVVTYNTLIDVYGKMGRWEDAVKVLSDMADQAAEVMTLEPISAVPAVSGSLTVLGAHCICLRRSAGKSITMGQGCLPETRTFNTAIIACNMCNQSAQALEVYERMQEQALAPTATTYTALVSAHCKSDNLDAALEVYNVMVAKRQERNIITYSSLIAAADRAGRWEEGLTTWAHMAGDRCHPNLPAYNSAISCCAQGGKWQQAREVFEQMKQARFKPDVSSYTALLAAYHPANKWRQALQVFEQMQAASVRPETVLYAAIIDLLWMSGIVGAQQRAQQLFQLASRQSVRGMQAVQEEEEGGSQLQVSIEAPAPSIAALAMHKWLQDLHLKVQTEGPSCLPQSIVLSVGLCACTPATQAPPLAPARAEEQGTESYQASAHTGTEAGSQESVTASSLSEARAAAGDDQAPQSSSPGLSPVGGRSPQLGQKRAAPALSAVAATVFGPEYTAAACQAAVLDMVTGFGLPFEVMEVESDRLRLEADGAAVAEWLQAEQFDATMTAFAQPLTSPVEGRSIARSPMQANLSFLQAEEATALNCSKAWESLRKFESFYPNMVFGAELDEQYSNSRAQCLVLSKQTAEALGLTEGIALDAILLLDRLMHQSQEAFSEAAIPQLVGSCLVLAVRHGLDLPQPVLDLPALADSVNVPTGVLTHTVERLQHVFHAAAPVDEGFALTTVSAVRCLNVYLERLGALSQHVPGAESSGLKTTITMAFESSLFVSVQPSLLAAVAYQAYKESQGILPAWPSALADLTGWKADSPFDSEFHKVLVAMRVLVADA